MGSLISFLGLLVALGAAGGTDDRGILGGFVFDALTGKPVTGALAVVGEDHYARMTDEKGRFTISGIPAGTYLFRVECRCFKSWIIYHLEIKPGKNAELQIGLSDPRRLIDAIGQDSVVVRQEMLIFDPDSSQRYR